MAKQKKKVNRGPHIRNAHLIGAGGGEVKPVDGSFVKGTTKRPPPKANPEVKKHISTQPAKKNPGNSPVRERTPGRSIKPAAPKAATKPVPKPTHDVTVVKKAPTIAKPTPKVITSKKAPAKSIITKMKTATKQQVTPKKPTPVKIKKAPSKGR